MPSETTNIYRLAVEPNQAGRYTVRVEARYAEPRWALRAYFQAATPQRVFARAAAVLRFLQSREEQLWMWGSNASDRSLLFEELLGEAGLELDQRREFPRIAVALRAEPGETLRPAAVAELKRKLSTRMALPPRTTGRALTEMVRASA